LFQELVLIFFKTESEIILNRLERKLKERERERERKGTNIEERMDNKLVANRLHETENDIEYLPIAYARDYLPPSLSSVTDFF
jgi:hypothetical protein